MKIAIVGTGVIARVHAKALLESGESIAALCDTDTEKAALFAKDFGLSCPIFEHYSHMLRDFRPDAVHLCTPHYLHADMIVEALSENIHVLCEKPLCIREQDIPRILAAEKASSAFLGVCHQNRYNPANRYVKEMLDSHPLKSAHGTVAWSRTADYYRSADWRGKWETEGGGVMINQALHTLDLLLWFCGEPTAVCASVSNLSLGDAIEVEDTASARFDGSVPFSIFATVSAGTGHEVCLQLHTESGSHLTLLPHAVLEENKLLFSEDKQPVCGTPCYGNSHKRLSADFYDCIRSHRPFVLNGKEGARVILLILGIYQSKGERITL